MWLWQTLRTLQPRALVLTWLFCSDYFVFTELQLQGACEREMAKRQGGIRPGLLPPQ